jgi:hypothetical protein
MSKTKEVTNLFLSFVIIYEMIETAGFWNFDFFPCFRLENLADCNLYLLIKK